MSEIKICLELPYSIAHRMVITDIGNQLFHDGREQRIAPLIDALKANWTLFNSDTKDVILRQLNIALAETDKPAPVYRLLQEFMQWAKNSRPAAPLNAFVELPVINSKKGAVK